MYQFVERRPKPSPTDLALQALEGHKAEKKRKPKSPWLSWPECKKKKIAEMLKDSNYAMVKVQFGSSTPPRNTIVGWGKATNGLKRTGRPSLLSAEEEIHVMSSITRAREMGCVVDIESIIVLGMAAARAVRGDVEGLELSRNWAQSFKSRHDLGNLKTVSSTRPPCSPQDIHLDNVWRRDYHLLVTHPTWFGIEASSFPLDLQVAGDETPVHYGAKLSKTYVTTDDKQVRVNGGAEKRMTTGCPITTRSGKVICFQVCKSRC